MPRSARSVVDAARVVGAHPRADPGPQVLEQELDRLGRVLLVRADDAARPALDPARAVHAWDRHAGVVEDAAAVVPDRGAALVERDPRHRRAAVADAPQDEPARDHLALARSARRGCCPSRRARARSARPRPPRPGRRRGSRPARRRSAGRPSSACPSAASRPPRACRSTLRRAIAVSSSSAASLAGSSSSSAGSIDEVGAGELGQLLQLRRRERGLRRPAAAEHEDLADPRAEDRRDRLVGRVGRLDLLGGEREHPGHVDRDVPVADDDGPLAGEVEREVLEVGVAVVPGDERRRGPRAREGPRRGCPSAGRPARRRRRRPRRRAPSARRGRRRGRPRRCRRSGSPGAARSARTRARRT